jgi:hypothetical protein
MEELDPSVPAQDATHIKFTYNFKIRWIVQCQFPFSKIEHLINEKNDNQSIKNSKNGQEIPYKIGNYICSQILLRDDEHTVHHSSVDLDPRHHRNHKKKPRDNRREHHHQYNHYTQKSDKKQQYQGKGESRGGGKHQNGRRVFDDNPVEAQQQDHQ